MPLSPWFLEDKGECGVDPMGTSGRSCGVSVCGLLLRVSDLSMGGTRTDSWAPSGLPLGRLLAVHSPGWPRAHRDGIHETQAQLSGKSVFNFWSASGSRSQVCSRGGGLQAQQPARRPASLRGQGPRHPLSRAWEVRGASSGLSSGGLCVLRPCFPSLMCMGLRRPF